MTLILTLSASTTIIVIFTRLVMFFLSLFSAVLTSMTFFLNIYIYIYIYIIRKRRCGEIVDVVVINDQE